MGELNSQSERTETVGPDGALEARRRLLRAGLAAAPVMMVLKSRSALANGSSGGHCKPSVWSSLKQAKDCHYSHTVDHAGNTCHHYTDWAKDTTHSECGKHFHRHPTNDHVPFDGADCNKSTNVGTYVPTLKEICNGKFNQPVITITGYGHDGKPIRKTSYPTITTGDPEKDLLAKHCAAMYLNATVDHQCPITTTVNRDIWNSCKNGGSWTPPGGGEAWSRGDCIEYFEYVCKGTKPAGWNWDSKCV